MEQGFYGFSMKQVTQRIGVSEALLYRYFPTKEDLFFCCFESVHKSIAALFVQADIVDFDKIEDTFEIFRLLWLRYFDFLVKARYRTIFYFDYRDSGYMKRILQNDAKARDTYFASFISLIHAVESKYHVFQKINSDYLWTYILDTTGIFAKRVIRGELPASPESFDMIYKLLFGGIGGLFSG